MEETMYQYLLRQGVTNPEETKLVFVGEEINSEKLTWHIDKIASFLASKGVAEGESVGVCLPNMPQAVIAVYAINKMGGIVNSIHPLISTVALCEIMQKTKTRYLFLMDRMVPQHIKSLTAIGVTVISCAVSDFVDGIKGGIIKAFVDTKCEKKALKYKDCLDSTTFVKIAKDPLAPAVYLHSGGTEGQPKTVVLNSRAFNELADNIIETACSDYQYSDKDSMLMVLPVFHGFGLGVSMHTIITHGRLILQPSFNAKQAIKLIKKYRITFLAGIPQMYRKMMDEKSFDSNAIESLKFIFCGGDKLPDDLKLKFDEILKRNGSTAEILEGYGLTEATTVVSVNRGLNVKLGSQGRAIVGADIRIVDENTKEVKYGEVGEIIVTCPSNMLGYLDDENATNRCFVTFDGKQYVRTGDVGYMDEDGYLYFKERSKRVVKIMGVNVFPSEIENIVTNMKEVDSACVVGIEIDGKPATKLLVVMNPLYRYSSYIEERIKEYILENTIKYAVPKVIEAVPSLLKTAVGKVDYKRYQQ